MTEKKTCANCEKAIKYIKRTLLSLGRRLGDLEYLKGISPGATPYLNEETVKVQKKIVLFRGLLEIIEPPAKHYTGIFPGKGREVLTRKGRKK